MDILDTYLKLTFSWEVHSFLLYGVVGARDGQKALEYGLRL